MSQSCCHRGKEGQSPHDRGFDCPFFILADTDIDKSPPPGRDFDMRNRDTMKNTAAPILRASLVACALALLVSCVSTPDDSYLERNPVAFGQRTGRADAEAGRDADYTRHLRYLHPSVDEDDFEDAYDDAYGEAEDEMEDRRERPTSHEFATRQAYDAGFEQGELDRHRGLSRNPDRHSASRRGSSSVVHAWISGYEDGWNER
jgi:hypothetical protein